MRTRFFDVVCEESGEFVYTVLDRIGTVYYYGRNRNAALAAMMGA
jgi:hypothetical protein